jgi:hypothetical protein
MAAAQDAKNPPRRIGESKKYVAARSFAPLTTILANPLI